MTVHREADVFQDRADAGRWLAKALAQYRGKDVIVFGIPRGGVPVAIEVAEKLGAPLDIIIPRKIAIPFNTEAGYGAVTEEGAIVLNEPLVSQLGLTKQQIEIQAESVRAEIARRSAIYRAKLKAPSVEAKTAIIIDDGLASGFTMAAAIKSVRQRKAAKITVAVPVASGSAYDLVKPLADKVVCLIIARVYEFAVASFYRRWHDLTDEEVLEYLEGWRRKHVPAAEQKL
jgi:predicted phosphoribosyltransferase